MQDKIKIKINLDGTMTFIYRDDLEGLLHEGESSIRRVSNVEPCEGGWQAVMADGTKLGVHRLRKDALDEEIKYIENRMLGEEGKHDFTLYNP